MLRNILFEKNINKMRLLFIKLFIINIFICAYGFRNSIVERLRKPAELEGKCGEELLSVTSVALITSEEKAYYKILFIK